MSSKEFLILDGRDVWFQAAIAAGEKFGYTGRRIAHAEAAPGALTFVRLTAEPKGLKAQQAAYWAMRGYGHRMIQDGFQIEYYEDKSAQLKAWPEWLPKTWRFTDFKKAMEFAQNAPMPIVSKADVGASSVNVRVFRLRRDLARHIKEIFGKRGVRVRHCAAGASSYQKDYVLLQRFIPHKVTWRVNAIGGGRAIFKRFCYPNKPVAQTGNVKPVMELDAETESLLAYADKFFELTGTGWCAIDVLKDGESWKMLETSLAWPWPSPGMCNQAPIFRTQYKWIEIWEAMFAEVEAGRLGVVYTASI